MQQSRETLPQPTWLRIAWLTTAFGITTLATLFVVVIHIAAATPRASYWPALNTTFLAVAIAGAIGLLTMLAVHTFGATFRRGVMVAFTALALLGCVGTTYLHWRTAVYNRECDTMSYPGICDYKPGIAKDASYIFR